MVVDKAGRPVGNLGTLMFPQIPPFGSTVLAEPFFSGGRGPIATKENSEPEMQVYRVVDAVYQFHPRSLGEDAVSLSGWEIEVEHIGPYSDRLRSINAGAT